MLVDENLLYEFESGLNPQDPKNSPIAATIIGYGEISAIFQIGDNSEVAFKRLPLFSDRPAAEKYSRHHDEYCHLLTDAGLSLPEHQTIILEPAGRPVFIDLAANLYKEQRPELIPVAVDIINVRLEADQGPLTDEEVKKYYRQDRIIWSLYLTFRRVDRWLTTKIWGRRYEYILPGKIQR